ncbi:MAG TPA: phytase [Sphingomonas sp.]|nr:phytase [Sphingomonas sp.]
MRTSIWLRASSMLASLALPAVASAQSTPVAGAQQAPVVAAAAATTPTAQGGANMAVIANAGDAARARILGTAELAGIEVYGLDGARSSAVSAGEATGIGIRSGFPLGGQDVTLAVVAETTNNSLRFFAYRDGALSEVGARAVPLGFAVEDVCLWHSVQDGNFYAIAIGEGGRIDQQLVFATADGRVDARQARQFNLASEAKHCVADDRSGALYIAEEAVGIWRFDADPEAEIAPRLIDAARLGRITKEVGGVALYHGGADADWLIASDASSGRIFVYDRAQDDRWLGAVSLAGAGGAPVGEPGGLFATAAPLGARFPNGVLVAADEDAPGGSTYQLVSMADVATALGVDPGNGPAQASVKPRFPVVAARVETVPVKSPGDAADDPAIWADPDDPAASLIVATDKKAGLYLYDMKGQVVDFAPVGKMNNVDLRTGFVLDGKSIVLVAATDRTRKAIGLFMLDIKARKIVDIADGVQASGLSDPYGLCMYRSAKSGRTFVFASDPDGLNRQWEVVARPGGKAALRQVRDLELGSQTEGCVADDTAGAVYIDEEDVALWRFDAEPDGATTPRMVDSVERNPALKDDLEGISLYDLGGGKGYLVLSSQGNNSYAVYDRTGDNAYRGSFSVVADGAAGIDGISETDGLDVSSSNLGPGFEHGAMVAQDGRNVLPGDTQNFKIVRWSDIAAALKLDQR